MNNTFIPFTDVFNAMNEIKCIHQSIGNIGVHLNRCKPGSKLHIKLMKSYDELLSKSFSIINELQMKGVRIDSIQEINSL